MLNNKLKDIEKEQEKVLENIATENKNQAGDGVNDIEAML
jgi:hypothetical protein